MDKNRFIKAPLLGTVLLGAFVAAPAMADDFDALNTLSTHHPVMSDAELAAVEGGDILSHLYDYINHRFNGHIVRRSMIDNHGPNDNRFLNPDVYKIKPRIGEFNTAGLRQNARVPSVVN